MKYDESDSSISSFLLSIYNFFFYFFSMIELFIRFSSSFFGLPATTDQCLKKGHRNIVIVTMAMRLTTDGMGHKCRLLHIEDMRENVVKLKLQRQA